MIRESTITEDDLIAELDRIYREALEAGQTDNGWMTTDELARGGGCSVQSILKKLREAKRAGRLETSRAYRENVNGFRQRVPVYRLVVG